MPEYEIDSIKGTTLLCSRKPGENDRHLLSSDIIFYVSPMKNTLKINWLLTFSSSIILPCRRDDQFHCTPATQVSTAPHAFLSSSPFKSNSSHSLARAQIEFHLRHRAIGKLGGAECVAHRPLGISMRLRHIRAGAVATQKPPLPRLVCSSRCGGRACCGHARGLFAAIGKTLRFLSPRARAQRV